MAWSDAARAAALAARKAHAKHMVKANALVRAGQIHKVYEHSGLKHQDRNGIGRAFRSARAGGHYAQKKYFAKAVKQAAYAHVYARATGIKKVYRATYLKK